jgi:hypothetical protein
MTVAISRPLNLKDILTKTKLQLPPSINIEEIIEDINTQSDKTTNN